MTESKKTILKGSMNAAALKSLADYYSKCGLHSLAADTYRNAAVLYHDCGDGQSSQECRCACFLSTIAA